MYNPSTFRQTDFGELRRFMHAHPLATLVARTEAGLDAAHVPLLWADNGTDYGCLRGHFSRGNPIWKQALGGQNWLAVFQDAGHYISPNDYPSKQRDHKAVPTWNFQAVHAQGKLTLIEDSAAVKALLAAQTAQHEPDNGTAWQLSDAPDDYIHAQSKGVVCFELTIEKLEGKYKLSQNQRAENRQGVINGLQQLGTPAARRMAEQVAQYQPHDPEKQR
ncbi:FMN-binding negative transcriptional regulator [Uruburuella testudinis]|uniref:FMN-binding negative transcriptional regulator n=1 Tax=Uruburuella testudinis TaxID=1282863 RepID=A0ABY4DSF1_9NEIS|nr:FMN-binding negative transcriptional regulator [Uruburuella testudinis]UOO81343.1 FMN-binding negative transcriptional regulator [Uruburuella testudinis]